MRKSGKIIGLLLTVALVVTSLSSGVFADSDPEIVDQGENEYYTWYYYSDKFLDIGVKQEQCYVPLDELSETILDEVESVMVFVNEQNISSLSINGAFCNASSLLIRGDGKINYNILTVSDFPNVVDGDKFVIPEGEKVTSLMLSGFSFTSLAFINKIDVYSLTIASCNELTEVVLPSCRGVAVASCENLKKAEVSSTQTIFHFDNCDLLTEVRLPKGLTEICTDAFEDCNSLSDIYYGGSEEQWDKIHVLDHYDPTELKADDVIGEAEVHFAEHAGWVKDGEWWTYYDENCEQLKNEWLNENGSWYYFGEEGYMATGFYKVGSDTYYFKDSGAMVTGWLQYGTNWYYFNTSGKMALGWNSIGGKWYYFNAGGDMATGWKQLGGKWYYFNAGGDMATGWKQIGGLWYYFNAGGDMATGWQKISGKWYYFNAGGDMVTGWKQSGGTWYYFNADGDMATGWKQIGGKWYYFYDSGAMASNTTIDGWTLDSSGAWTGK